MAAQRAAAAREVGFAARAYEERVVPAASGTASAALTCRGYVGEEAGVENVSDPALFVDGPSYVHFEGGRHSLTGAPGPGAAPFNRRGRRSPRTSR